MPDNIWESEFFTGAAAGGGYFLRFEEGQQFDLTWADVEWRDQDPATDARFKTATGKELLLKFNDGAGVEHGFTAKDHKNKLVRALRAAGIQLNDSFTVVRTGQGAIDTTYTVTKAGAQTLPEVTPF